VLIDLSKYTKNTARNNLQPQNGPLEDKCRGLKALREEEGICMGTYEWWNQRKKGREEKKRNQMAKSDWIKNTWVKRSGRMRSNRRPKGKEKDGGDTPELPQKKGKFSAEEGGGVERGTIENKFVEGLQTNCEVKDGKKEEMKTRGRLNIETYRIQRRETSFVRTSEQGKAKQSEN